SKRANAWMRSSGERSGWEEAGRMGNLRRDAHSDLRLATSRLSGEENGTPYVAAVPLPLVIPGTRSKRRAGSECKRVVNSFAALWRRGREFLGERSGVRV